MAQLSSTTLPNDTSLPSPREFLTSLLNTLTSQEDSGEVRRLAAPSRAHLPPNAPQHGHNNAFKSLPMESRAFITTLHVLFPGVLLQALDLLDRRLVTKIIYEQTNDEQDTGRKEACARNVNQDGIHATDHHGLKDDKLQETVGLDEHKRLDAELASLHDPTNFFYLVQSAQPSRKHNRHGSTATSETSAGLTYTVRLQAWNCSCAAFAFSAFPATVPAFKPRYDSDSEQHVLHANQDGVKDDSNVEDWDFGNLSSDGKFGIPTNSKAQGGVPVCKHLLAALLIERWGEVLGRYASIRHVERDEMAGLGSD